MNTKPQKVYATIVELREETDIDELMRIIQGINREKYKRIYLAFSIKYGYENDHSVIASIEGERYETPEEVAQRAEDDRKKALRRIAQIEAEAERLRREAGL